MGRSDFCWGRNDWGRNDHGAKWPDTPQVNQSTFCSIWNSPILLKPYSATYPANKLPQAQQERRKNQQAKVIDKSEQKNLTSEVNQPACFAHQILFCFMLVVFTSLAEYVFCPRQAPSSRPKCSLNWLLHMEVLENGMRCITVQLHPVVKYKIICKESIEQVQLPNKFS